MRTINKSTSAHSEEHFGPQRDFWWNRDFLDLMAARWRLAEAQSLADIGCGLCHWSRLLYPYLHAPAKFAGVDRETRWIDEGEKQFRHAFPKVSADLLTFHQGMATAIPLPDNAFDVVTCQTVLMHLAEPLVALREMLRILKPGGLLVCAEPNNLWSYLAFTSLTADRPTDCVVREFEFWFRCHRGRIALGQGCHSIGDLVPGYFSQLGLENILVYVSDRAHALFPPYESAAQQALLEQDRNWKESGVGSWDRANLSRLFLAGGGEPAVFEQAFEELSQKFNREQEAIKAGTFHGGYGSVHYLVSGRKP